MTRYTKAQNADRARTLDIDDARYLNAAAVAEMLDVHAETIARWRRDPWKEFPRPVRIGRAPMWRLSDLSEWVERR